MSIDRYAQDIVELLRQKNLRVAFAESCTGGMAVCAIVSVPNSSEVLDLSIITYADRAKIEYTDVTPAILAAHGAVSSETALAMASGIRKRAGSDIGVGITGIAGPGGGSSEKPVGTVYIAVNDRAELFRFNGDRQSIREQTTLQALRILYDICIQQETAHAGKGL
jgi:PncC family amidohydrolase